MDFRIDCPCGQHVIVTEASAGATLKCDCGRTISVPSSPALRVAAGLTPYDPSPEQVIHGLLAAGKLPGNNVCIHCGFETDQVLEVETECETSYRTSTATPLLVRIVVSLITLPLGHIFIFRSGDGTVQRHGRDTKFVVPIPACEHCHRQLRRRKLLKKCMQQIPEYSRLLGKFPQARVTLRKPRPIRTARPPGE
jgi:hypothetical protein